MKAKLLIALLLFAPAVEAQQPPMTIVDLINVPSVGDPQLSPDGSQVLYVRSDADWEANGTTAHIWRVNADGTGSIRLTSGERDWAHKNAERKRRGAGTAFLAAPLALGYWLAHQIEGRGLAADLLAATAVLGAVAGLILARYLEPRSR